MKWCCNCSFNKCLKERKETLEKELTTIINNWIKEHSEITKLFISTKGCYMSNMTCISKKDEIEVSIKFDD